MKPEYRYEVILCWSEPDEAFIAELPELPGALQAQRRRETFMLFAHW